MKFATRAFVLVIGLSFAGQLAAAPQDRCAEFTKSVAKGNPKQKLKSFLDVSWKYWMTEYPEWATYVGYPGQNARWSDQSLAGVQRHQKETLCQLKVLKTIPRKALSGQDRVTYDLALHEFETNVQSANFGDDYMPVNHMNGFQIDAVQLFTAMPVATVADYENILKRFEGMPLVIQQNEELMREGLKRKLTPVKAFLGKITGQIDQLTTAKVEESPMFQPFKEFSPGINAEEQKRLSDKAREILTAKVYPALQKFKTFMTAEYIPQSREYIAFTEMPDGKAWYAFKVKKHTTTDKTPEELHQLGLNEVERITAQMNKIREQVKFKGDLKTFNKFLLTDKSFHYKKAEDLLAGYRETAKRADAELPKLFKRLPRLTYGVRAIADFAAPSSSGAQYIGGSLETGRPGWFEANTYDLPSRPKWDMETLTLHEAVPGHHLQIAIAQELEDLPEFRKHGGFTAYIEGWALYAESLGDEMGFFKDPYSKYGNLSGEMMRSIRLVVDTGMHAKGWSKQQALDYYRSKMPISDIDSEVEIDRYITWPGQALAYKVGQLKFRELRESSKVTLGDKFDVREFHDQVLKNGALPLAVLEKSVQEWVAAEKVKKSNTKVRRASL